jgi:hypothetical protein
MQVQNSKSISDLLESMPLYGPDLLAMKNTPDILRILKPVLAKSDCNNIINWGLLQTKNVKQVDNFLKVLDLG